MPWGLGLILPSCFIDDGCKYGLHMKKRLHFSQKHEPIFECGLPPRFSPLVHAAREKPRSQQKNRLTIAREQALFRNVVHEWRQDSLGNRYG
mmetsp:Transcript_13802/g.17109  ORF Transcript_13802/g.17109 Transcript_13802/m.17109 type:complete len:92 (+) Transcript_13802:284-559(+)